MRVRRPKGHDIARLVRLLTHPPIIDVDELIMGRNVRIEPGVEIHCRRLVLGDGVTIRSGTRIEMTDLVVGDYTKINPNCLLSGTDWCRIGHNGWFGDFTVIDSIGTMRIGNGVCAGVHSQLWTHAYFGDVLEGCRFASHKPMTIGDDAWLVGHCVVSPVKIGPRSMALAGSVVTREMLADHVYAGVPAEDVTAKVGTQFERPPLAQREATFRGYLDEFTQTYGRCDSIRLVDAIDPEARGISQFNVGDRSYLKSNRPEEVEFMRFLLPTKAKFVPHGATDWVGRYLAAPG